MSSVSGSPTDPAASAFVVTHETHAAVVFAIGGRAYKLKKPVKLGFLDFSTRQLRQAACAREVTLNRRTTPDVYLGVADIHGPDGSLCDHLVVMRRMPPDRRLSTLVRAGAPVDDQVQSLARTLAAFHADAVRGPEISVYGSRDAILGRWRDSFAQVRQFWDDAIAGALAAEIEEHTEAFLAGRQALFDERISAGRIVDGHGDLLADDVFCLDDGPRVLDCIEFDDKLRWLDGLDDAAFLAMDLERLGAPRLGTRFLDWYAEFSGDPAPLPLRRHYVAYRAFVRAKVACLRYGQGDAASAAEAARCGELTVRHLRAGRVRLILVGGLPATGKSTLASGVADRLDATLLSSDRVRKELAGLSPRDPAGASYRRGIYSQEWSERTYRELLDRAEALLVRGGPVVLDASWSQRAYRDLATALAGRSHSTLTQLRCDLPSGLAAARLRARGHNVSDADEEIATAMAADAEAWPDATRIDTTQTPERCVNQAMALIKGAST